MAYTEVRITVSEDFAEVFIAELGEIGFDTFEQNETGVFAYIPTVDFANEALLEVFSRYEGMTTMSYTIDEIEKQNWNEQWEKNYDPIAVGDKCRVRAIFHTPDPSYQYEIVINPKMSFGTGHHATTNQMLALAMSEDFDGKNTLDVGAGTGVLAIMAHMLGATSVEATDVDDWCIENCLENFGLNGIINAPVHQGIIYDLTLARAQYEMVFANINKNVLMDEIPAYAKLIPAGGKLFLSGFYESDVADIASRCHEFGLSLTSKTTKDNWAAIKMTKS